MYSYVKGSKHRGSEPGKKTAVLGEECPQGDRRGVGQERLSRHGLDAEKFD